MNYILKRQTSVGTESVFKGEKHQCINWLMDAIKRNKHKYTTTVNLVMEPVWLMDDRAFWLEAEQN